MVTEDELRGLVELFYGRVRQDELLGPVFDAAVEDWPGHLDKLQAFWSSVMLTSGRYKGNPMAAHMRQARVIRPEMFDRWLAMWRQAAADNLSPEGAAAIIAKADRIAESLKLGLYFRLEPASARAA